MRGIETSRQGRGGSEAECRGQRQDASETVVRCVYAVLVLFLLLLSLSLCVVVSLSLFVCVSLLCVCPALLLPLLVEMLLDAGNQRASDDSTHTLHEGRHTSSSSNSNTHSEHTRKHNTRAQEHTDRQAARHTTVPHSPLRPLTPALRRTSSDPLPRTQERRR